jgi:hypothetical protein
MRPSPLSCLNADSNRSLRFSNMVIQKMEGEVKKKRPTLFDSIADSDR